MEQLYVWLIIAAILLVAELLTGTFVLVFFAIGAFITALMPWLGYGSLSFQIVVFALTSTLFLLLFRRWFLQRVQSKTQSAKSDVGHSIVIDSTIEARATGTVTYQGSPWTAVNEESQALVAGTRARISKVEGVTLFLKKES